MATAASGGGGPGPAPRTIALLDANAFFASCSAAADPSLRGKPIVVAGDPQSRHGIILAVSYEARRGAKGPVRAGMPLMQALKVLPPDVVLVPPNYVLYAETSRKMFAIMRRYTPLVEGASIDEGWMDWTGCLHLHGGDPITMALRLKAEVRRDLNIQVSIGIAWSKVGAKMAAELQKPDGLTWLTPADWPQRVWLLPAGDLYGVGPRTAAKLQDMGIRTIGDLAAASPDKLRRAFGVFGDYMLRAAAGQDDGVVDPDSGDEIKSISHSLTLPADVGSREEQRAILLSLSDQVGRRMRRAGLVGRTVTVQIRDTQFNTITRGHSLTAATDVTETIYATACDLLAASWPPGRRVRLLGVAVSGLVPAGEYLGQLTLFDDPAAVARRRQADRAADVLRDRFGEDAVVRGGQLISGRGKQLLDKRRHGTSFQRAGKGGSSRPDDQAGQGDSGGQGDGRRT